MIRRILLGALAFTIALSILVGLHYYVALRLVLDPELPSPGRELGLWTVVGLGLLLVLGPLAERGLPRAQGRWLAVAGTTWMGTGFWIVLALAASDLLLWVAAASGVSGAESRDTAALRAALVVALVALASGFAARNAARGPRLVRREVALPRWPAALDGFRLAQISDIHIGPSLGRRFADEVTARVNALEPDLVAVTGDLADGRVQHLAEEARPFSKLAARHGVYFVTGNHDHYSGVDSWVDFVEQIGLRPLRNTRVRIERDGAAFDLAGVDDHRGGMSGTTCDLDAALAGRDPELPVVLLAHDPSTFPGATKRGVDLQLSGHTHGGQMWPFRWFVRLATPFVAGHYTRGTSQLYVSRGTGFWGPPLRLFAPAEITELTLRSSERGRS